jgi:Methyl-accepting chemotaxis protein
MTQKQTSQKKSRNNTRLLILSMAAFILILVILFFVLYSMDFDGFNKFASYGMIFVILLMAVQLILLLRFFKAIDLVDKNANIFSKGELNISDILTDKTKGLETLTIAFNDMKRNLLNFIESTKSNVIVLSDAVDKVTKSLDMSYKGNEHIASNMATVAEKAQEQLKIVKDTLDQIQEVSERTSSITDTLANIDGFVENTVKMTEEGSEHLDHYNEQMGVISTNLTETADFIDALNVNLKEIDQVNGLIINITEQLTLLSLNSSIEAARAGEAGKGFVVVAHEMNKLSNATRDSIGQINNLLANILGSNAKVSESIASCVDSFGISKEIFNSVKDSFYTINKNANILNEDMKKVYAQSQLINENTKGISDQGQIIHNASQEISSITEDVAAVTEEELAENEEINTQAQSLKNMLSSIERLLKRYKTSITPVSQNSPKKLRIAFLSPLDHPFWEGVRQGALYAQNELKSKNVDVEYFGFEAADARFDNAIKEKIKDAYDGVIIPGFISSADECLQLAIKKNVTIMAFNCDFKEGSTRLSYFGPDVRAAGQMAGEFTAKAIDEEGEVAIFHGDLNTSVNKIRTDAINDVLRKKKKIKTVEQISTEVSDSAVYNTAKSVLEKHPNLKVIVIVTGGIQGAARAIEEMGRVGKTSIVCFDYDQNVIELIKKGIVSTAMGQDAFGQGHDPIIALYNYFVANEVPASITHTRTEVIDIRSI